MTYLKTLNEYIDIHSKMEKHLHTTNGKVDECLLRRHTERKTRLLRRHSSHYDFMIAFAVIRILADRSHKFNILLRQIFEKVESKFRAKI
jgi:hypothetical protein